jgi:regulator of PEP synthase PpsR (kinase-PPPase family)
MVKAVLTQFGEEDIDIHHTSYVEDEGNIDSIINEARGNESIIAYTIVIPSLKQYLDQKA